jgi:O-antigen ligase
MNAVYAKDTVFPRRENISPTPTPIPIFEDRSTSIRLNVEWPRAIRAFIKNPLLGTGYSSITLATDNDYLRLLGEIGVLGFFSFTLIFAIIGKLLLTYCKKYKDIYDIEKIFIASATGGFFGVLINALFIDVFEASKFAITFWLLIGMYYSIVSKKYQGI